MKKEIEVCGQPYCVSDSRSLSCLSYHKKKKKKNPEDRGLTRLLSTGRFTERKSQILKEFLTWIKKTCINSLAGS